MKLNEFYQLRDGLRINAAPATAAESAEVAALLQTTLWGTGLFHNVEVDHTEDPDRLVIAMVEFAPDVPTEDVAFTLEHTWIHRVAYPFWATHSTMTDTGHVELQGAARSSSTGHYVTVHVVAQEAAPRPDAVIPTQAAPTETVASMPAQSRRRAGLISRLTGR